MSNGLPSLLDAIFGKNDLALVSLDEMYEVVNEFPSFNAAHFLLSKKLKDQDPAEYEKQCMKTALYFNNAFWLQTLLDEGNHSVAAPLPDKKFKPIEPEDIVKDNGVESPVQDQVHQHEDATSLFTTEIPVQPEEPVDLAEPSEPETHTVSSFDELLLKYHLTPEYFKEDTSPVISNEDGHGQAVEIPETKPENDESKEPAHQPVIHFQDRIRFEDPVSEPGDGVIEIHKEILNEYGVFEEVTIQKNDLDLDAFDRPVDQASAGSEIIREEIHPESVIPVVPEEIAPVKTDKTSDIHDYESFDRPLENTPAGETENGIDQPEDIREITTDKIEDREEYSSDMFREEPEPEIDAFSEMTAQQPDLNIQEPTDRFEEEQKSTPVFDPKTSESIVFAPYHMVDYFASQGIKLVLEDNPKDHFGQQLKSFTDWLKVMKKLPGHQPTGRHDEKEAEQIRHFAAHSLEDRDVLTESMAEVLAKQGMYENAIAIYQKLSLIYPPKSAYFASRIEQLKASLP